MLITSTLIACNDTKSSFNDKQIETQITQAPNIKDIYPIELPNELSFPIKGYTITTYQNPMPIHYIPSQGNLYYYDHQGNKINSGVANGYYRQVLGKDNDGKTVVQDFYQDTKTPYNSPFLIKKGGDESLFNRGIRDGMISKGANDSMMAWFDKQGNLFATQLHIDGLPIAFLNIIKDGQWIGRVDVSNNKAMAFYPNTTTVMFLYDGRNYARQSPYIIYHKNGNAMAILNKDNSGNYHIMQLWNENGQITESQELKNMINKDYIPLLEPYFKHIQDFIGYL